MPKTATPQGAPERITVQARTTARVRERLEEAARESGRSLSQEMEMRLEQSLFKDDAISQISNGVNQEVGSYVYSILGSFGGKVTFALLQDLGEVINCVERHLNCNWYATSESKAFTYKALEAVLPAAIRAFSSEADAKGNAIFRSLDLINRLPFRPKPRPPMPSPEGMRFATEQELAAIFYLQEDNADMPNNEAPKRNRTARTPLEGK